MIFTFPLFVVYLFSFFIQLVCPLDPSIRVLAEHELRQSKQALFKFTCI